MVAGVAAAQPVAVEHVDGCLLCGTKGRVLCRNMRDHLGSTPDTWTTLRCPRCGLVWLSPRPIEQEIGRFYPPQYATHFTGGEIEVGVARGWKKLRPAVLAAGFGYNGGVAGSGWRLLGNALARVPLVHDLAGSTVMWVRHRENGKLLDVGCGNGHRLQVMRQLGWDVLGIEPDPHAVRAARQLGVPVLAGTLDEAGLSSDTFDAVTLGNVIEHVHDPIGLLRDCARVLKPGGQVALVTPNVESVGHKVWKRAWSSYETPRHLYLFSMETLRASAERAGLVVEMLRTSARIAWLAWLASTEIRRKGTFSDADVTNRTVLEGAVFMGLEEMWRLLVHRSAGEEIIFVATKPT